MKETTLKPFTEIHHAMLFAWIARETIQRFGEEKGSAVIRKAVRRYGEQRGGRMARRAQANADVLSMTNFLVYGEWRSGTGDAEQETVKDDSDIRTSVSRCPWANAWNEGNLVRYGRLYCQEIDKALVRGFNPDLIIEVKSTLTNDGEPCEFIFHQAAKPVGDTLLFIQENTARLTEQTVMPWEYHCGHLYKTFGEALTREFGAPGEEAVGVALAEFAARYEDEAARVVVSYQGVDFDCLPES